MINRKYKVLHVLQSSLPKQSGYAIRSYYILKHQKNFCAPVAVTSPYYAPEGNKDVDVIDGVTYYRCYPGWVSKSFIGENVMGLKYYFRSRDFKRYLHNLINFMKPSIIHAHTSFQSAFPAYEVAHYYKIPFIYEVRGVWEDSTVAEGNLTERCLRYKLKKRMETFLIKNSDFVVTICESLRDDLLSRGAQENRIAVVPNGVDTNVFDPSQVTNSLRDRLKLKNCTVIGYIGNIRRYEGLDVLLKSIPLIINKVPSVRFILVGDGNHRNHLRKTVQRFNLDRYVIFTGGVPIGNVANYFSLIDIFVISRKRTRQSELVTPIKPLEAMAMGKVVLTSRLKAMSEMIVDGKTGIFFEPGNPIDLAEKCLFLVNNESVRIQIGNEARRWVIRHREWQSTEAKYEDIYGRLLNEVLP